MLSAAAPRVPRTPVRVFCSSHGWGWRTRHGALIGDEGVERVWRVQERAKQRQAGVPDPEEARKRSGFKVATLFERPNAGVSDRDRRDQQDLPVGNAPSCALNPSYTCPLPHTLSGRADTGSAAVAPSEASPRAAEQPSAHRSGSIERRAVGVAGVGIAVGTRGAADDVRESFADRRTRPRTSTAH